MMHLRPAIVLVIAVLLGAPATHADPGVGAHVAALSSADYAEREAAHRALLMDDSLTIDMLAGLYRDAQTLEERQRLHDIARHHILRLLRLKERVDNDAAAVGVSLRGLGAQDVPQVGQPGAMVVTTLPGFPGHGYLREGDIIIEVNGQRVPQQSSADAAMRGIITLIQQRKAGQSVGLTIVRGEKRLHVTFELAAYETLGRMYGTEQVVSPYGNIAVQRLSTEMDQAWREHWQRAGIEPDEGPAPLEGDLSAIEPTSQQRSVRAIHGLENLRIEGNARVIIRQDNQIIELLPEALE